MQKKTRLRLKISNVKFFKEFQCYQFNFSTKIFCENIRTEKSGRKISGTWCKPATPTRTLRSWRSTSSECTTPTGTGTSTSGSSWSSSTSCPTDRRKPTWSRSSGYSTSTATDRSLRRRWSGSWRICSTCWTTATIRSKRPERISRRSPSKRWTSISTDR